MSATSAAATSNSASSSTFRRTIRASTPSYRLEILLQYLQRHDAGSGTAMLGNQLEGPVLLGRGRLVVRVLEDMLVKGLLVIV
jgi:hypothetical protein